MNIHCLETNFHAFAQFAKFTEFSRVRKFVDLQYVVDLVPFKNSTQTRMTPPPPAELSSWRWWENSLTDGTTSHRIKPPDAALCGQQFLSASDIALPVFLDSSVSDVRFAACVLTDPETHRTSSADRYEFFSSAGWPWRCSTFSLSPCPSLFSDKVSRSSSRLSQDLP